MALTGQAKVDYQREYMRKYRSNRRSNTKPVNVRPEQPKSLDPTRSVLRSGLV